MEENEKLAICKIVAYAIMVDRQITDEEYELLQGLMTHYGLTDAQKNEVMSRNFDEDLSAVVADVGEGAKLTLLEELAAALFADGALHRAERQVIDAAAEALAIPPEQVEEALTKAAGRG